MAEFFGDNFTIILGNAIALLACSIMVGVGFIKKKEKILWVQCIQFAFFSLGNFILKGYTGVITNFVCIIRNIVCLKWKYTLPVKIIFLAIQVALSAMVNNMGLIGWLPVIAAGLFTWALDIKDEVKLKYIIIICQLMWACYDLRISNYATMVFDIFTIGSNVAGIRMIKKERASHGQ